MGWSFLPAYLWFRMGCCPPLILQFSFQEVEDDSQYLVSDKCRQHQDTHGLCNRGIAMIEKRFIRGHVRAKSVCVHTSQAILQLGKNWLYSQSTPTQRPPFPRHREVPRRFCTHPLSQMSEPTACKLHCDCPCWSASLCTMSLVFFAGNKDHSDPTLQLCWLRGSATFSHLLKPLHVYCGHEALGAVPLCHRPD